MVTAGKLTTQFMRMFVPRGTCLLYLLGYVHTATINGGKAMKRFIASVVLAIALLTSGVVVTQQSLVDTAYAAGGGGE
jgi:hypothetical protein